MPASPEAFDAIAKAMRKITTAWRAGTPDRMSALLSEQVVTAVPSANARAVGREVMIEGFEKFSRDTQIHTYEQGSLEVDAGDRVAVATHHFDMTYDRAGSRWHAVGWNTWVFERRGADWVAIWRMMHDVTETPA